MQHEPKLSEPAIPYTKNIRFWSKGKMAATAYDRYSFLKRKGRDDVASSLLNEWVID